MFKRITFLFIIATILTVFCACTSTVKLETGQTVETAPIETSTPEPTPEPTQEPTPKPVPEPTPSLMPFDEAVNHLVEYTRKNQVGFKVRYIQMVASQRETAFRATMELWGEWIYYVDQTDWSYQFDHQFNEENTYYIDNEEVGGDGATLSNFQFDGWKRQCSYRCETDNIEEILTGLSTLAKPGDIEFLIRRITCDYSEYSQCRFFHGYNELLTPPYAHSYYNNQPDVMPPSYNKHPRKWEIFLAVLDELEMEYALNEDGSIILSLMYMDFLPDLNEVRSEEDIWNLISNEDIIVDLTVDKGFNLSVNGKLVKFVNLDNSDIDILRGGALSCKLVFVEE